MPMRFALDGCAVGDGWLGILDNLATQIVSHSVMVNQPMPRVLQMKEKLGALQVYLDAGDDHVRAAVTDAEIRSVTICDVCGDSGQLLRDQGWLRTRCDRRYEPCLGEALGVLDRDVLHTAIGVVDEAIAGDGFAVVKGLLQRVENDPGVG